MTNRLTPEQLAQIRERAEKATEGPWDDFDDDWDGNVYQYDRLSESAIEIIAECSDNANRLNDANFIAHAREDIPNLLAHIDKQSEEIRYYKGYADRYSEIIAEKNARIDELEQAVRNITAIVDSYRYDFEPAEYATDKIVETISELERKVGEIT